jgi:multiple sugar transport system substrate-binding protein
MSTRSNPNYYVPKPNLLTDKGGREMSTRKTVATFVLLLAFMVTIAACAPAATPAPAATSAPAATQPPVVQTVIVAGTPQQVVVTATPLPATATPEPKPYAGQTLHVLWTDAVPATTLRNAIADPLFRERTGANLVSDVIPFNDMYPKETTMCQAESDYYDVMFSDGPWYGAVIDSGCAQDLTEFIKNDPDKGWLDDFPKRTIAYQAVRNGKVYAFPSLHAVGLFTYRTDLFNDPQEKADFLAKYGRELTVPKDWEEYLQVGQFFTRPDKGLWGTNHRYGSGNNIVADSLITFVYARGGTLFDSSFHPTINTQAWLDAETFFLSPEFKAIQPPGVESFQFADVIQNMEQGKVAMYATETWAVPSLMDPKESPYAAKISMDVLPGWKNPETGEIQHGTMTGGGGFWINSRSKNKALAYEYLKFLTGPEVDLQVALQGGVATRTSSYTNAEVLAKWPHLSGSLAQVEVSHIRASEPWWTEVEFVLGKELNTALIGQKTVEAALADAQTQTEEIVRKAGYYDTPHTYLDGEAAEEVACKTLADLGIKHPECP